MTKAKEKKKKKKEMSTSDGGHSKLQLLAKNQQPNK